MARAVPAAGDADGKCLVVAVAADLAGLHGYLLGGAPLVRGAARFVRSLGLFVFAGFGSALAAAAFDALAQERHQVHHLGAFRRPLLLLGFGDLLGLAGLDLLLDALHQVFVVRVVVALGLPFVGHVLDQAQRHV